ncbi:MAG: C-GCAxxG-C-C family protein [Bacteroidota bacterium]
MNNTKPFPNDTKKMFWKCGTCSHTLLYLLNREFGYQKEAEERASDLLAGGIMNTGHQCGMLWGASLAVGAESFRRFHDTAKATSIAITTTQHLLESFSKRTKTLNCREITGCDLTSKYGLFKLSLITIFSGFINSPCFKLADKWVPEAIETATEGLSQEHLVTVLPPISCASEVVRKMGGSDEEIIMVAGFAGGLGLSGNACGALSAAIWMNILAWCRKNPGKIPPYFKNPATKNILHAFYSAAESEINCHKITGQSFKTIDEHSEFIKNGGCNTIINLLAESAIK